MCRGGDVVAIGELPGEVSVTFKFQRPAGSSEGADTPLVELVDDTGEQRSLCTNKHKFNGVLFASLIDLLGISWVDGKIYCNGFGPYITRTNKQTTDKTTLGKPPCNGMVFGSRAQY